MNLDHLDIHSLLPLPLSLLFCHSPTFLKCIIMTFVDYSLKNPLFFHLTNTLLSCIKLPASPQNELSLSPDTRDVNSKMIDLSKASAASNGFSKAPNRRLAHLRISRPKQQKFKPDSKETSWQAALGVCFKMPKQQVSNTTQATSTYALLHHGLHFYEVGVTFEGDWHMFWTAWARVKNLALASGVWIRPICKPSCIREIGGCNCDVAASMSSLYDLTILITIEYDYCRVSESISF